MGFEFKQSLEGEGGTSQTGRQQNSRQADEWNWTSTCWKITAYVYFLAQFDLTVCAGAHPWSCCCVCADTHTCSRAWRTCTWMNESCSSSPLSTTCLSAPASRHHFPCLLCLDWFLNSMPLQSNSSEGVCVCVKEVEGSSETIENLKRKRLLVILSGCLSSDLIVTFCVFLIFFPPKC